MDVYTLLIDLMYNAVMFIPAWAIAFNVQKRRFFALRTALCFIAFTLLQWVYFLFILPLFPPEALVWFTQFGFFLLIAMLLGAVMVCFRCNFFSALFCASTAYAVQHICTRLDMLLTDLWLDVSSPKILFPLLYLLCLVVCCGILLFALRRLQIREIVIQNHLLLIVSVLLVFATITLETMLFSRIDNAETLKYWIRLPGIIIALLIILNQFSMLSDKRAQNERDAVRDLLKEAQEQYNFEKAMIDIINVKAHDLKHYLNGSELKGAELPPEIKPVIEGYDISFKTGNPALDAALTKENFRCQEKNIELTCAVEGALLSFMSEVDIYSLFGNILDNAIEAVEKLTDASKRVITLFVEKKNNFVFLHTENYYNGRLQFHDGIPTTDKDDTGLHGYGMKSIRMITEKYNGNLSAGTVEDRFVLDIMFSL